MSAPVATISHFGLRINQWTRIKDWLAYFDADADPATKYQFIDNGALADSAYFWTPNNPHHPAGVEIEVAASDLADVWVRGGTAGGLETMSVRAFDGTTWGSWQTFTLTTLPNDLPVVTVDNHNVNINEWAQISNWLSYSDADGDAAVKYRFIDGGPIGSSGYFWTPTNPHHPAGVEIEVAASDLANVWVRGGTAGGSETFWVRVFDGTEWGGWDTFTLTTLPNASPAPIPNNAPVATINNHNLRTNEWAQIANWLSYSDADGNPAIKYEFFDGNADATSGYFSTPGNPHHPGGVEFEVAASDLASVQVRGGTAGGLETFWVRAFDGTSWSQWDTFLLTTSPNNLPIATISDHAVDINEWIQIKNWLSYSDADGHAAIKYEFSDGGTDASSGYFWTPSDPHHPANTSFEVAASDLANVWVRGGTADGSENMSVRAFDGIEWSSWHTFTFTTLPNNLPIATIDDHSVSINQWTQVHNWLSYSNADGLAATKYQFLDGGSDANSGYFWTPSNPHHAAGAVIEVAASEVSNVWVRGGTAGSSETMSVRAFDGVDWGLWDTFEFTTLPNALPIAAINDQAVSINQWAKVSGWLSFADADGHAATKYQFLDGGSDVSSGYFWSPSNPHHAAGVAFEVAASGLADVWVRGGTAGGSETMSVRAFDGIDWGPWDTFTFTTTPNSPPVAVVGDQTLSRNEWAQITSWLSFSDADGQPATKFQFYDNGLAATSGYFWTPSNPHHSPGTTIEVLASELANVWVRGGSAAGTENMMVRAFDGIDWGAWDTFALTTT
jgi:hypothetical protein